MIKPILYFIVFVYTLYFVLLISTIGCERYVTETTAKKIFEGKVVGKLYEPPYDDIDTIPVVVKDESGWRRRIDVPRVVKHNPEIYEIDFIITEGKYKGFKFTENNKNFFKMFSNNEKCFIETEEQNIYRVDNKKNKVPHKSYVYLTNVYKYKSIEKNKGK